MSAEKTYSVKAILEKLNNALDNGYEELGETDIGDLLLECEVGICECGYEA